MDNNELDLTKVTNEDLAQRLEVLGFKEEEVVAEKVAIKDEIMARLDEKKMDGIIAAGYQFIRTVRLAFTGTSLEDARIFGAIKEAIDTTKLSKLVKNGAEIPGMSKTVYLMVRKVKEKIAEA